MANPAGDWQDHGCSEGAAAVSAVMQVHRDGAVVSVHETAMHSARLSEYCRSFHIR